VRHGVLNDQSLDHVRRERESHGHHQEWVTTLA
jgi:hypothetical protein